MENRKGTVESVERLKVFINNQYTASEETFASYLDI